MKVITPQYNSPTVHYDPLAQVVIVQRVDIDTGAVTFQSPSEKTVEQDRIAALGGAGSAAAPPEPQKAEAPEAAPAAGASVSLIA